MDGSIITYVLTKHTARVLSPPCVYNVRSLTAVELYTPDGKCAHPARSHALLQNTRHAVGETRDGPEPNSLEGRITNILGLN